MFSLILRRTHMYLALFLSPWVLMYTLSTIAMNHRSHLRAAGEGPPRFELVEERSYSREFPSGTPPQEQARAILNDLGLDGAHTAGKPAADGSLTIQRLDPVHPTRLVWSPARSKVRIEKIRFETPAFLERMHRKRGFQQRYFADQVWGVLVDFFIVAMVLWAATGLWMWWEMKVTRLWGAVFLLGGLGLFAFFLATI